MGEGQNFVGHYKMKSSDNMDAYLKAVGINFAVRKVAQAFKSEMTIEIDDDENWTITTTNPMKTMVVKFKLGQETEADFPTGRMKARFDLKSPTFLESHMRNEEKGEHLESSREMIDEQTMKLGIPAHHQQQAQQHAQPAQQQAQYQAQPPPPPPQKFASEQEMKDQEHIKSHLDGQVNTQQQMTNEQLQFHYFTMHDLNKDNRLDGIELCKAITHFHGDDPKHAPPKLGENEIEDMIDSILKDDDYNMDGFIDFSEFLKSQAGRS